MCRTLSCLSAAFEQLRHEAQICAAQTCKFSAHDKGSPNAAPRRVQVLVYGDCAVNVSPSAGDLANIAIASADTAAAFGVQPPRVALLSYSTGASGSGAEVEKVGR